jgi:hypothetical protein
MIEFLESRTIETNRFKYYIIMFLCFVLGLLTPRQVAPNHSIYEHNSHIYLPAVEGLYYHDPDCGECLHQRAEFLLRVEGMLDGDVIKQRALYGQVN